MVDIVINYSEPDKAYKVFEPTTNTLLISQTLTEALCNLSLFLQSQGLIQGDILQTDQVNYHFDSRTMRDFINSNVQLLNRLKSAPSGFTIASQRFGGSTLPSPSYKKNYNSSKWGGEGEKKFKSRGSSQFSGASGFKNANKKFGNKK